MKIRNRTLRLANDGRAYSFRRLTLSCVAALAVCFAGQSIAQTLPTQPTTSAQPQPGAESAEATQQDRLSASKWLDKLASTVKNRNFQVSMVRTLSGQETVPYLWRHAVLEDGTVMEQLNLQNGPGQEQIRVGDVVSVFEPDVQPYSIRASAIHGPIPPELLTEPQLLQEGYDVVSVGRARISGKTAQQLRIISRDNSRFSYQLWLDEDTGMLLKFNTLDLQENVLEQIQVTALTMTDLPHPYFSRVNQSSLPEAMAMGTTRKPVHNWEVGFLPAGMHEVSSDIRRLAMTGQVVEYKMFSDGLVDVSVYVQPAKNGLGSDIALRHELNTFLTLVNGSAQVTVVGEIPLQTASAMARSLTIKGQSQP